MATTYSFASVAAAIVGPNGSVNLGYGAGPAEEGITIEQAEDKDGLTVGADGSWMHSLHVAHHGTVTVRLLKTSPTNKLLGDMYNADTSSAALHGQNVISIRNPVTGDTITAVGCAFKKLPNVTYAKDGGTQEWMFNAGRIEYQFGSGSPAVI